MGENVHEIRAKASSQIKELLEAGAKIYGINEAEALRLAIIKTYGEFLPLTKSYRVATRQD